MMTSIAGSEDRPAYDVLARKTVEVLDVVNLTRQLLIEQYNNDQTMWMEAMFRILMWKNEAFLQDERNSSATDVNVHKIMKDLMLEMFRATDEQNPPPDSVLRNQLFETGCNLISTFRVFTNFLLHSKLDVANDLANLQYIGKNIDKYVQKHSNKPKKPKSAEQENVKSVSELEKAKSLVNETMRIANETVQSIANESLKVKPVANESLKVKPVSNEPQKTKSSESQKVKPIGSEIVKAEAAINDVSKMKPATSKRNINEETFGSEAIALAWNDSVVVSEKRSTTPNKMKGVNDNVCDVCKDSITVFNCDKEFSLLLHEEDSKHKKAVKQKMYAAKEVSVAEPEENSSTAEKDTVRKAIVDLVGEAQARFFRIDVGDEFFCTACKCSVYSTFNVVTHVQGRNHKRNTGFKSQESKESRSGSDSRDMTSDEVDSAEDDAVFRVGSTIPIKSLF